MKITFQILLLLFAIPAYASTNYTNSTDTNYANATDINSRSTRVATEKFSEDEVTELMYFFNHHAFCEISEHIGTKLEQKELHEYCDTIKEETNYPLVIYYPPAFYPKILNQTLNFGNAMAPAFLRAAQKMLESNKHIKYGALAGAGSSFLNMFKQNISVPYNTTDAFNSLNDMCMAKVLPVLPDLAMFGANAVLLRGVGSSATASSRIVYSALKILSALTYSSNKWNKEIIPEDFFSEEGFEFIRYLSLHATGPAYLVFAHFGAEAAVKGVVAYRSLNHLYALGKELCTQEEFHVTNSLMQNLLLTNILAAQVYVYLHPFSSFPHLANMLLAIEYILAAGFAYNS